MELLELLELLIQFSILEPVVQHCKAHESLELWLELQTCERLEQDPQEQRLELELELSRCEERGGDSCN